MILAFKNGWKKSPLKKFFFREWKQQHYIHKAKRRRRRATRRSSSPAAPPLWRDVCRGRRFVAFRTCRQSRSTVDLNLQRRSHYTSSQSAISCLHCLTGADTGPHKTPQKHSSRAPQYTTLPTYIIPYSIIYHHITYM